jgi:biotin/methionine sulfoxide reductase
VQISTGAWYDPAMPGQRSLDKHGNPNVLTPDRGTSKLAQATTAHSCLIEIERFDGVAPPVTCYDPPALVRR